MKYKVYVGSIPGNLTDADVLAYFTKLVSVREFILVKPKGVATINKGYGFLTVETEEDCNVLLKMDHYLAGRKIKCEAVEKGSKLKEKRKGLFARRIFISNVPQNMRNQEIEDLFSKFGSVESAYRVSIQSSKKSSGFGYVTFCEERPAKSLVTLQKLHYNGATLSIQAYDQTKAGQIGPAPLNTTKPQEKKAQNNANKISEVKSTDSTTSTTGDNLVSVQTIYSNYNEGSRPTTKHYHLEGNRFLDHKPSNILIRISRPKDISGRIGL